MLLSESNQFLILECGAFGSRSIFFLYREKRWQGDDNNSDRDSKYNDNSNINNENDKDYEDSVDAKDATYEEKNDL